MNVQVNRIRDLREDADLTQEELAKRLGYHTTTYKRWEQNIHGIKLQDALNLADYYNVSLDYIAGRTNDKKGLTRSELSDEETELIKKYRSLSEKRQGMILWNLKDLCKQQSDENALRKEAK